MTKIVQIRKKGGLNKIIKDKNSGGTVRPMLYRSKTKNRMEDGVPDGEYKGKSILDTKHFIAPMWNDIKGQWSFSGNDQDLGRLISKMKLRYPKNHPKQGLLVEPGKDVNQRLTNRQDDVFNHPDLYGKYYMENGRISLNLSDARQEFLFLCYKGDTSVEDKSSEEVVSKYFAAGAKYELVSPKNETMKKKRTADKEVKAIKLLAAMEGDVDKMRAVASIMALPQFSPTTSSNGLFILLKDMGAQNNNFSAKYNKTYQDRFIELAEMADDDLNVNSQVMMGKTKGILRRRQGHYLFNGDKLDGLDNDLHLVNYFRNPKNQEDYIKLVDLLT